MRTSYYLFNVIYISGVVGFITNWIVYTRLDQVFQAVQQTNPRRLTSRKLANFFRLNVQYLTILADLNRVHGAALFDFIFLSYPSNATIVSIIVTQSKKDPLLNIILIFIALFQIAIMLVCHLCVTRMTATAHRPVGPMIRVNIFFSKRPVDFKAKLKLSHYIAAFHTDKKYGLNYRQFGPITFATYQKVLSKFFVLFHFN